MNVFLQGSSVPDYEQVGRTVHCHTEGEITLSSPIQQPLTGQRESAVCLCFNTLQLR